MFDFCSDQRKVRNKTVKNITTLFLLIILALSFFSQLQEVNAQDLSSTESLSSNPSLQTSGLPETVVVYMMHLDDNGFSLGRYCYQGDGEETGCVEEESGLTYPPSDPSITYAKPGFVNPLRINIENYYLKNVLPREMDVATYDPPLEALKAQALAARSIADWKAIVRGADEFKSIDNSVNNQIFKPGSYDFYDDADSTKADEIRDRIDQAILETSGQYLFYPNDQGRSSLDAEFSNDIGARDDNGKLVTVDGKQAYLIPIQDPISDGCDLSPVGNGWGMSQKGAMRWAKGNQCAGSEDQPWSVKWDDYRQILAHYYTGIDILNDSGNPIAPGARWNLLRHNNFEKPIGEIPILPSMSEHVIDIQFQNTSTFDWHTGEIIIGYQWTQGETPVNTEKWREAGVILIPQGAPILKGKTSDVLSLSVETPITSGLHTLHLDLKRNGLWFSEQGNGGWPDAEIKVYVAGTIAFVIDDTGSMVNEIGAVKSTINQKVDAFFERGINPIYHLITYKDYVDYQGATSDPSIIKEMINNLTASGGGSCPEEMLGALEAVAQMAPNSEAFVMTDASFHGGPKEAAATTTLLVAAGVKVNIISYGSCSGSYAMSSRLYDQDNNTQDNENNKIPTKVFPDVSALTTIVPDLPSRITTETGGHFFQINSSETDAATNILLTEMLAAADYSINMDQVVSGSPKTYDIQIDETTEEANFLLNGLSGSVNLELRNPNGVSIGREDPDVTFTDISNTQYIQVSSPAVGTWQAQITGNGEFTFSTSGDTSIEFEYLSETSLQKDEEANLQVSLNGPITYATFMLIQVDGTSPETVSLFDDGMHNDENSNDGIYGGTWTPTGTGKFYIHVQGTTEEDDIFERVATKAIRIKVPPTVLSSVRASVNPTSYYNVDYTVTFSEPVTGVDISDFTLTVDGVTDAVVSAVSGSDEVYTVTVKTGFSNGTIRLDVLDNDTIVDEDGDALGGTGYDNGNFTSGDSYEKITGILVNKLEDTNDGLCDIDCSLREAIASASPGETITFDAGLSNSTIRLASPLTLSQNITIDGSALESPITISGDTDGNGLGNVQILRVNAGATITLNKLIVSKGYVYGNGGGIYNNGVLTVANSTFTGNNASSGHGGAIYNMYGTLIIENSTFSNNFAYRGGAIYNYSQLANITNSTFSNNSTTNLGGTIYNSGTLTLIHDTISGGSASSGGGILNYVFGVINISNIIIANSTGGDCINNGILGTNIQNLVEDSSCSASLGGDPMLGLLADNGGLTQTMALMPGSPALNTGDRSTCANSPVNNLDQRGITRLLGGQCDLGAYEVSVDSAVVPVVETFAAVTFSASLNVAITDFTASDDTGVTGYIVTKSPVPPTLDDAGWLSTPPPSYSINTEGVHILYPWVKDADGHISSVFAQPVSVTVQFPTATPTHTPTPTPTATPYPNVLIDEFNDTTLASYWEWYVPKVGPTYSLSAVPGTFRISLPAFENFEHWESVDDAPQLRLRNFGPGNWAIETRLENVNAAADAGYWAAMTVGFPGYDQIWFGMVDDGYLKSYRLSEGQYFALDVEMPIILRLEKIGENYTFKYKSDSDITWTVMPAINYAGIPTFVGLIGRGFNTGSAEMHMDWSYFRIENWSVATPTPTASTETPTPTVTNTGETPTPSPRTVLDEFNGTVLGYDWEWYRPATGPNYSLSAEPNYLQIIVPPGYDHWSDMDTSPQIRRSDMGDGDWSIETHLELDDFNLGDAWQINLMAGFDRYDQQWLSIDSDNTLHVTHIGEDDTAFVDDISLPIYLRMERMGNNYTFKYKEDLSDPWITLDVQSISLPVAYVGLQFRSFTGSSGDAIFNVDYFQMETSTSPDPGPTKDIVIDDFTNQTLNGDWVWYVLKPGPNYSLTDISGSLRMILPAYDSFEHWGDVDDAPQLRRIDLGTGDWAIETQLENITATDAGYWAALEVGFDQSDQIWFGMVDDGNLKVYRLSEGEYAVIPVGLPVILRIEKHGETFIFKYRHDPAEAWTSLAPKTYSGTPTYVGIIGRGYNTGVIDMLIDWSYFRLERWTPSPQGLSLIESFEMSEAIGNLGQSKTGKNTQTPSLMPHPSPTLTLTPEFPIIQSISTPTYSPTTPP